MTTLLFLKDILLVDKVEVDILEFAKLYDLERNLFTFFNLLNKH